MKQFTYQLENVPAVIHELMDLAERHYELNGDLEHPFDPNWDTYLSLAKADKLLLWTARHNGRVIGYIVSLVFAGVESQKTRSARLTYFYVEPRLARGLILRKLLNLALDDLKKMRISQIKIEIDSRYNAERLLKPLGFVRSRLVLKMETVHG